MQAVARKVRQPQRMKAIAVGHGETILPQLNTLGLGGAELREADGQPR